MRRSFLFIPLCFFLAAAGLVWIEERLVSLEVAAETRDAFFEEAPSRSRSRVLATYRAPQGRFEEQLSSNTRTLGS